MLDVNREYADLFEKYGTAWADAFNKVRGRGWILLPVRPKTMEERNRVFVEYAYSGFAVFAEGKYGIYYVYVKKPTTVGRI